MTRTGALTRLCPELERFLTRQILGLEPDPDHWPRPHDVASLSVPPGLDRTDEFGPAWVLDLEFVTGFLKRRSAIGAQAYRFTHNREFDCGWRLVDVAARFLRARSQAVFDLVSIIPPPPVYSPVPALDWTATRLAGAVSGAFEPALILTAAPFAVHPDTLPRPQIPLVEMFTLNPACQITLADKRTLLLDWRWHSGRSLTTVARLLARHGAKVVRFAFLP